MRENVQLFLKPITSIVNQVNNILGDVNACLAASALYCALLTVCTVCVCFFFLGSRCPLFGC